MSLNMLGVNISDISKEETLRKTEEFLADGGQHYLVTPNPEIILEANKDEEYFYILNKADLALPDGIGLKFAGWFMGRNITRMTGADLVRDILRLAEKKSLKVAVMNRRDSLSRPEDIAGALKNHYPGLKFIVEEIDREWAMPYYQAVNIFRPDIVFVTLGAPWQEKFIYHSLPKMPFARLAIGVGGAFDFLTGKIKRAPKTVRALGLEWLWRLEKEPWRWRRIFRAAVMFPLVFFKWRFILPYLHRSNVACLLYKKAADGFMVLMVERNEEPGHWQLPQGGTDGENAETAGMRELAEELGTNGFRPVAAYKNLWKYEFTAETGKYGNKRHAGYRGQKQGLLIAEYLGKDEDIRINYWDHAAWKWVRADEFIDTTYPARRQAYKIYLEKFYEIQNQKVRLSVE